eukprot:TRINITY_DN16013_c0_g1_i1.p1 TRINITY_DN16013_c0_g1~~TRINITY_DN16013_c0_g1_i1.p1  ORF type:complete len:248 (-),score=67.34 TRINITY_DN16013_c0_g1_i1:128-871(-)
MSGETSGGVAGETWSSLKGSWRRTKEKALQKIDKERQRVPYDEEYDKKYDEMVALLGHSDRIGKEMKRYLDSQRVLSAVVFKLATHVNDCALPSSSIRGATEKFLSVSKKNGDPEEKTGKAEPFLEKALNPWTEYVNQYDKFKRAEEDREKKELDYLSYKHKVEDLQLHPDADPDRLPRNEKKMVESRQLFEYTHYQLKRELFDAYNKRCEQSEVPLREALSTHIEMCKQQAKDYKPVVNLLGHATH